MKCRFCLKDNGEDARFCSHCGRSLEQTCSACGTRHLSTARFCKTCGTSFEPLVARHSKQEGERKLVSVLFADAVGFTSLSEMLDPEEVAQIMQDCLFILTREIERHGGTVTQFTGDGVMALFGAPSADEDHAKRACHAAIAIRSAILPFSDRISKRYGSEFRMRIGINSGVVVVGSVDSGSNTEYTALGDAINIASRIESIAPPGAVCCSADTFKLARDHFEFVFMGTTKVKGKARPLELYKVQEAAHIETRLGAAMARGLTPFVGRSEEMRDLAKLFDDVMTGEGKALSIIGEAGVGKSRLLFEFHRSLHGKDVCFLVGECLPFGASIAYLPLLGLLRSYFRIREGVEFREAEESIRSKLSGLEHDVSFLLPPLFDVLSIPYANKQYETMEPHQKKEKIFQSLTQIFLKESQAKPLVIAIESAMWIDRTSEEFIAHFTDLLPQARILLILLCRPGYTWNGRTTFNYLTVHQLPPGDAPQLVNSLLDAPPSPELEHLLLTTSGGNPLFIEELTNSLFEKGYVDKTNGEYSLKMLSADLPIPATIHGIIAARIDHLPEPCKHILQFAAVVGKRFSRSILEVVAGRGPDLTALLRELVRLDLISSENAHYHFKHDLVQEVAYNSLLVRKRKEIHEAVAVAIEGLHSANLDQVQEILAYHFSKSNNNQKAYGYLKQSGAKNTSNSSLWEAFRFYNQAIEIARDKSLSSQREALEIRLQMASAMISLGFPENSLEILRQAETIARSLNDKKSLVSVISMIGLYYSVRGDTLRGIRYALDCLSAAREARDVDLIAPIVFDLCSNYAARGEYGRVVRLAPVALSLLKETGKQEESFSRGYNIYSAVLAFYAFSLGFLGQFERAASLFEEGLKVAGRLENLYSMGLNEILYGYLFCQKADGRTALSHFDRSIQYLERGQIFVLLGLAWNGLGRAQYFLGDLQSALVYAEKGLKVHTDAGVTYNLSAHFWFLALINHGLGNLTEARSKLEESFRLAKKNRESYYIALSKMLWGRIELDAGSIAVEEAERVIGEGVGMLRRQGVYPQVAIGLLTLAEISLAAGNFKKTSGNLRKAHTMFKQMGMAYWTEKAEKLAHLARS